MGNDQTASEEVFKLQFPFLLLILKERLSHFFSSLYSQKVMFFISLTERRVTVPQFCTPNSHAISFGEGISENHVSLWNLNT